MTPERLAVIEARLNADIPGPTERTASRIGDRLVQSIIDAADLLAEVRALRARVAEWEEAARWRPGPGPEVK